MTGTVNDFAPWLHPDPIIVAIWVNAVTFLVSRPGDLAARHPASPRPGAHPREQRARARSSTGGGSSGARRSSAGSSSACSGPSARPASSSACPRPSCRTSAPARPGFGVLFGAVFVGLAAGMWLGPRLLEGFSRRRLFGLSLDLRRGVPRRARAGPEPRGGGPLHHRHRRLRRRRLGDRLHPARPRGRRRGPRADLRLPAVRGAGRARAGARASGPRSPPRSARTRSRIAPNFQLTYNGAAWVFLLAGVLALVLGVTAFRQMDDRRGVPLLPDLLSAWRATRRPAPPAPHGQARPCPAT